MAKLIKLFIGKKRRPLVTKSDLRPKPMLNCPQIYKTLSTQNNAGTQRS